MLVWPARQRTHVHMTFDCSLHIRMVMSREPLASELLLPPSDCSATTQSLWHASVCSHVPVSQFQILMVLSNEPEAILFVARTSKDVTKFVWPVRVVTHSLESTFHILQALSAHSLSPRDPGVRQRVRRSNSNSKSEFDNPTIHWLADRRCWLTTGARWLGAYDLLGYDHNCRSNNSTLECSYRPIHWIVALAVWCCSFHNKSSLI